PGLLAPRAPVPEFAQTLNPNVRHRGGRAIPASAAHAGLQALDVFSPAPGDFHARTVHSFKGEDSDAVMVVVRRPYASDPTSQIELWEAAVTGTEIDPRKAE